MNYTVYYTKGFFWRKLKNVKGDGVMPENNTSRFFILEDETRIEIPIYYIFKFSKERFISIQQRMGDEVGQDIRIKKQ